ncbi:MAG: protein kinase, partial [Myxococcales bacterium]|nr:protein kinase [Myxococcales bacterium]
MKCPTCGELFPSSMRKCPIDRSRLIAVDDSDPLIGRVLDGRYKIIKNLGSGAVGAVYHVEHVTLKKAFAAKILYRNMRPTSVKRFEREAFAASKVEHPSIVQTYDFGYDDDLGHYCILEFLQGETLQDRMRRLGPMTGSQILPIVQQLGGALQAAHDQGIVHRDLKPTNIFVTESEGKDRVKILDFGLAKLLDDEELEELSHTGQVLGTPSYMAPEQTKGAEHVDHRADIYAMGLIVYRMVTGKRPFDARTVPEVMQMQLTVDPEPPDVVAPGNPAARRLKAPLARALKKEPRLRYQHAREFVAAIEKALSTERGERDETITGQPSPAAARLSDSQSAMSDVSSSTPGIKVPEQMQSMEFAKNATWQALGTEKFGGVLPSSRRWPTVLTAVLGALLVGALVVIYVFVRTDHKPGTPGEPGTKSPKTIGPSASKALLIVAPFEDRGGDPAQSWMRVGLTDMFIAQLAQDSGVSVISRQRLLRLLQNHPSAGKKDDQTVYELARRLAARYVLWGSFAKLGGRLQLTVSVEDLKNQQVIFSASKRLVGASVVTETIDEIAEGVRSRLTGKPTSARKKRKISELRTSNFEAYREFIRGEGAFSDSRYEQALAHYKRAVLLDPNFMMARYGLAQVYEFVDQRTKARAEMDAALKLVSGRSRAEELLIRSFHAFVHNRMRESLRYVELLVDIVPKDTYLLSLYGEILTHNLEISKLLKVGHRLLKIDPTNPDGWQHSSLALSDLGRHDEAEKLARDFVKQHPKLPRSHEILARVLYHAGKYDEALSALRKLPKSQRSRWYNDLVVSALVITGRCEAALKEL